MRLWPHQVVLRGMLLLETREQVLLAAPEDDLVVNIIGIHDELHAKTEVILHNSADNVSGDIGFDMAEMGIFVHRWATRVPRHHLSL